MTSQRLRIAVEGVVQGVGFRPFVHRLADRHGVRGFVTNRAGDVVIEAEADAGVLRAFVEDLSRRAPANARVERVTVTASDAAPGGETGFAIAASDAADAADAAAAIAPDLATCDACLAEIADPSARRFGYAFTSCAACGPRLTIVTAAPYDRARTTMASFPMCDACRAEYDDAGDRRYHAQPIACPACGPRLDATIAEIAAALRGGEIVALKGLGGYHLACDATREDVVVELRRRKQRDAKPFAVMVADAGAARAIAEVGAGEHALLESAARPIVLLPRRADGALAPSVAPGVADVGVMLPYTPLHALLVAALPGVPLVMTSGNASDEPIAYRDDDARARLAPIADRVVAHDRPIHMRCDDSVARVVGGAPMLLRRARGYAPATMRAAVRADVPTLALGGHGKASFALGAGELAFCSPHFGDLDHPAAYDAFVAALAHFGALHRVAPERVVCDRHPDYATTRLAHQLAHERGWELVSVQHHHAHFASALADARLAGPAIGVVFDGAGLGDDGAIWGGEILVGDHARMRRAAHLAYVPQPGGDRASDEPWRMAIAHLRAAGERAELDELCARLGPRAAQIEALCARPALAPPTSSIGRLFDAVAAIAGVTGAGERVAYEGQAAMQLEALARGRGGGFCSDEDCAPYAFAVRDGEPLQLDAAPIVSAVARDARAGSPASVIARRFHATIVELAATACERVARAEGIRDVVLSGGVFANAILAEALPRRLVRAGLVPHVHRRVPPNDGGLAFGQLAIAAARSVR